jgi:hypothetical protein
MRVAAERIHWPVNSHDSLNHPEANPDIPG